MDGYSYERKAIEEWFRRGHRASPVTRRDIESTLIIPNIRLKELARVRTLLSSLPFLPSSSLFARFAYQRRLVPSLHFLKHESKWPISHLFPSPASLLCLPLDEEIAACQAHRLHSLHGESGSLKVPAKVGH
jgi:hypothetical protein